jgi:hypothetical protein
MDAISSSPELRRLFAVTVVHSRRNAFWGQGASPRRATPPRALPIWLRQFRAKKTIDDVFTIIVMFLSILPTSVFQLSKHKTRVCAMWRSRENWSAMHRKNDKKLQ